MKIFRKKSLRGWAAIVLLALVFALGAPGEQVAWAAGATITVNNLGDNATAGDGNCTLREAITNANNNDDTTGGDCAAGVGVDNIQFAVDGTITLGSTLPAIEFGFGELTIDGGGTITVTGNNAVRIFDVNAYGNLTLKNLTIADGGGSIYGAGLRIFDHTTVTIINCLLTNNHSTSGGGALATYGTLLTIDHSVFSNNSTTNGLGGGIAVYGGGTVIITNSTFSGNSSTGSPSGGGGLASASDLSIKTVTISNSTFSGNSANVGGGLYNQVGRINIDNSTFSGNSSSFGGGGVYYADKYAESYGPRSGTSLNVTNSTFSNNSGDRGGGLNAGIYTTNVNITNTTFSANSGGWAAGFLSEGQDTVLTNSTLFGNNGVGLRLGFGSLTIRNTIVAGNSAGNCVKSTSNVPITYNIIGPNLASDNSCPGFTLHGDAMLGPLADNGGSTATHAPLAGSPAIDAGDNAICQAAPVNNRDQRGVARPIDGNVDGNAVCDLGAYEAPFGTSPPPLTDSTPPTPNPTQSPAANGAGWNKTDVTVDWNWSDDAGGSGIDAANCATSSTSSGEGTLTLNATCKDVAGNTDTASYTVKVDKNAPSVSCDSADGLWHGSDVSVACMASDGGSGLANASDASFDLSTNVASDIETNNSSTGSRNVCDLADNCETAGPISGNKVDRKAPQLTICDAPDGNWHNTNVTLQCHYTDGGSGPATQNVSLTTNVVNGTETTNAVASVTGAQACDAIGNCAASPANIAGNKIDNKAPGIVASATTADNSTYTAGTWTNQTVTVHFTCSDAGSGIASCPVDVVLNSDGVTPSVNGTATDSAGNSAIVSFGSVQVDKTAPTLSPSISPNPVFLNASASASPNASDTSSGLASQSCGALNTSTVGTKTVICAATDKAGNSATVTASYSVIYNFSGFFSPVSNPPTVNSLKAGTNVSIIFGLAGNQGLTIFPPNKPTSQQIDCSSKSPMGSLSATNPPASSGLSYTAKKNQYTYAWQTDKTWAGMCRQFILTLKDGTQHVASFQFNR